MRTTRDRIRHAVMFEIVALMMVAPVGGMAFGVGMAHFGVVAVVSTTIAMLWNYVYNLGFDHALLRLRGSVEKTLRIRVAHAVLFEAGLLVFLVPFIALYLQVSLWEAFLMDVALAAFYLVYAFAFNLAYDRGFPVPDVRPAA
jgi:uncharacterized membrane protein